MVDSDRLPHRDRFVYVAAALLTLLFAAAAVWWTWYDTRPQQMDPATHLRRALAYGVAFRSADPREIYHLWRAEYGMYTYPPLSHVLTGIIIALGAAPAVAGAVANSIFAWILLVSVIKLGRAAFNMTVGIAAGALCLSFMTMAFLQRTAYPDFALVAMVAWACWRLVLSDVFESRRGSIVFGVVVGLAMLAKQMAAPFVGIAALVLLIANWRRIGRASLLNMFLASVSAGVMALPWYGFHYRIIRQIGQFNQYVVPQREGDPMPWTWDGATYYLQTIFTQLGPPLCVLGIVAALAWIVMAFRREQCVPRDQRGGDGRVVIVAWLVGGLFVVTFLLLNKDYRYHAPVLPALALVMASLLAWPASRGGRVLIGSLMVIAAGPYFLLATVGVSNAKVPRLLMTQWNMPPQRQDWHLDDLARDVTARAPRSDAATAVRLGMVPYSESYGPPSLRLEFERRRLAVRIEGFEDKEPAAAAEMDLVLTKTGDQGQDLLERDPELINRYIADNPAIFKAVARYALPDGSTATLYSVNRPVTESISPARP